MVMYTDGSKINLFSGVGIYSEELNLKVLENLNGVATVFQTEYHLQL